MHFALVHGAYHGAWCWDLLRAEFERSGHNTSAVDLPNDDPDAGAERYADEVIQGIPKGAGDVVFVGHSMAGLTIPIAAGRTPCRMAIYLCALLPVPGLSFDMQQADFGTGFQASHTPFANPDGSASWPEQGAIEAYFHDCETEVAKRAASRLRKQHWRVTQEVTPLREWPTIPSCYILCTEDRAVSQSYSRHASQTLLGVEPIEIPGGHSPFLSRPRRLASVLLGAAGVMARP
jgi:alpha/beta hydrolase family protein